MKKHEPNVSERDLPQSLLSVKEAAAYAGVSEVTVRRWISARHFPVYRAGIQIRIDPRDLVAFMRGGPDSEAL